MLHFLNCRCVGKRSFHAGLPGFLVLILIICCTFSTLHPCYQPLIVKLKTEQRFHSKANCQFPWSWCTEISLTKGQWLLETEGPDLLKGRSGSGKSACDKILKRWSVVAGSLTSSWEVLCSTGNLAASNCARQGALLVVKPYRVVLICLTASNRGLPKCLSMDWKCLLPPCCCSKWELSRKQGEYGPSQQSLHFFY